MMWCSVDEIDRILREKVENLSGLDASYVQTSWALYMYSKSSTILYALDCSTAQPKRTTFTVMCGNPSVLHPITHRKNSKFQR